MATNWAVFPEGTEPPKSVAALMEQVARDGGRVLAVYREPLEDAWQIFVLLPLAQVAPTPYQRDLSPTHAKRLQEVDQAARPLRRSDRGGLDRARASTGRRTATIAGRRSAS